MNRRTTLKAIGLGALAGIGSGNAGAAPGPAAKKSRNPGRVGNYNGNKTLVPPDLGGFDHEEWGEGQVHGTLGGTMGLGLRDVLTFPPSLDG